MKLGGTPAFALMAAGWLNAQTAPTPAPPALPPAYTAVRWNEDYSYLKDPSRRTDNFDSLKYIPLGRDDFYLSLGGQLRERYEYFNNNTFGAGPQDEDGYYLHRILLHADLHATPYFRAFIQGKSATIDDRIGGPRPVDSDEIDIQQGFFDIRLPLPNADKDSFTARVGRQDLAYGAQRVIGPGDWTNVRRTFEGVKLSTLLGSQNLDAFLVRPVMVSNERFNNGDQDTAFWGVYDTIYASGLLAKDDGARIEPYFLGLNKSSNAATAVHSDTYTLGARVFTNPKPWDLDVEAAYQFGQFGSGSISAYSIAMEGGYTQANCPTRPRPFIGFDIASGDHNPADGTHQTYNQLFPTGHTYFGYIDAIGRQNIIDLHSGLELTAIADKSYAKRISLRSEYHLSWRESTADAVYNSAGGVLRASSGASSREIGSELDLLLTWAVDRHCALYIGYSHFFSGPFIDSTGAHDDIDFAYAAYTFTF